VSHSRRSRPVIDTSIRHRPATNLPPGDQFEPSPAKVVGFQASLRRRGLIEQGLEDAPADTHDALVFADSDTELDRAPFGVPVCVWGKAKEHCCLLWVKVTMFR
jgi:hypothetical protein